ncbi:MAG: hypothetical protein ACKOCD_02270, partial [Nitrospiraceae bacterium]
MTQWCRSARPFLPTALATTTSTDLEVAVGTKLYVGSLPYSTTEQELSQLFSQHGT